MLTLVQQMPDPVAAAKEAGRRVVLGLRNDMGMTAAQIALIIPDPDGIKDAIKSLDVLVFVDPADAQQRGVFVMRRDTGGWAGAGFYVIFGFGPHANWLDYLEDVVNTFIAAGRGGVALFYPTGNPLGAFGAQTLQSQQISSSGIRKETANAAKQKITTFRANHNLPYGTPLP